MSLARVLDNNDFGDIEIRKHVGEVFLFFLPGLATTLKQVALEDEKVGYKIPQVSFLIFVYFSCNKCLISRYNN